MPQEKSPAWPLDFASWKQQFRHLISGGELTETQLLRWMNGADLPAGDPGAEPSLFIAHALSPDGGRARIAACLALLLEPRRNASTDTDERLYQMLELAAVLACPEELADPLERLVLETDLTGRVKPGSGFPLTISLFRALFYNQPDDRWVQLLWIPALEGRFPGAKLGLAPLEVFDAILAMPPQFIPAALKSSLPALAASLERENDREKFIRALPQRAKNHAFALAHGVTEDVLFSAMLEGPTPTWAVLALPAAQKVYACFQDGGNSVETAAHSLRKARARTFSNLKSRSDALRDWTRRGIEYPMTRHD